MIFVNSFPVLFAILVIATNSSVAEEGCPPGNRPCGIGGNRTCCPIRPVAMTHVSAGPEKAAGNWEAKKSSASTPRGGEAALRELTQLERTQLTEIESVQSWDVFAARSPCLWSQGA
ncbi:hypothetical protein Pst134EA_007787 [Puccinia striiformis f. sp. tritici]|uniref:hypothetical protein n=1 Tax=Puccinia striiformis f. sp. tritici TaxID=168172 RepID=UPI00200841F3|nr:hypothetical protein Pst134EA_007787 [Puccinia striiformis f. sp. tritici]KAH9460693.1 hypothetical protein Pst134EB_008855 [Puccinia striiformis f. sp. tritici]KAH9470538.1 hypothetical protein Pst134EA_007787 [Puccinia striiformis f. sp. tritici]